MKVGEERSLSFLRKTMFTYKKEEGIAYLN